MYEMAVQTLAPTEGGVPSNGYDLTSQAAYSLWEVNDEARFSVMVPQDYQTGADFYLTIQESSPSASLNHQWQVATLLIRPGVNVTDEQTENQTVAYEYPTPATADQLSKRIFTITGAVAPGEVSGVPLNSGDMLGFTLKRITASSDEDPNPIRVLNLSLSVELTAASTMSECVGRVGSIIDTVRDLFNEGAGGFISDDFIIRCINRCQQDLAQEDYWRRRTWIPATSESNEVDLLSSVPGYQDIHQVHFSGQRAPMNPLGSFREYEELAVSDDAPSTPMYYVVQNDRMYVWPPPNLSVDSGFALYHSYLPDELTCSSVNPNPTIPKAHDMLFVYFVLKQAFLRDRHAPGAAAKFREYAELYEREKHDLLGEAEPPELSLRSYR